MEQLQRGTYRWKKRARQLLLFDGILVDATITPMDIDCCIEYKNRAVVLIEVKRRLVRVPTGERLTLERFVLDFKHAGKKAIAIVADHNVDDPYEDVYVKDCIVREVYFSGELYWRPTRGMMTVKQLIDAFLYA